MKQGYMLITDENVAVRGPREPNRICESDVPVAV